jgi:hypothetical protein
MLLNNYQTVKQLELLLAKAKENGKGVSTTISVNENVDSYGNNVSMWISQTKEQRDAKESRSYVGNGTVVFSKAKEYPIAPKKEFKAQSSSETNNDSEFDSDLPF